MAWLNKTYGIKMVVFNSQVHLYKKDGYGISVLNDGRFVDLIRGTFCTSFVMSNSFTNETLAQIEHWFHKDRNKVFTLALHFDEKVARQRLDKFGDE
jgi:adenosylhomocysteinase